MYRPPGDIKKLRKEGRPWLVASLVLILLVISAGILFLLTKDKEQPEVQDASSSSLPSYATFDSLSSDDHATFQEYYENEEEITQAPTYPSPQKSVNCQQHSNSRKFKKAAVTSTVELCAEIGRTILVRGGNAIDAAIGVEMCVGAVHPHATGLGGGLIMVVHKPNDSQPYVINALSQSPRSVTEEYYLKDSSKRSRGYSSVACPGFLAGLWTAFKRFGSGKIAWQDLITPTIALLEKGFPVTSSLADALRTNWDSIFSEDSLNTVYPPTISEGDILRDLPLASTLRRVATARDPQRLFYSDDIASEIAREMRENGGFLNKVDLMNYAARVEEPLISHVFDGYRLIGPLPPATFAITQLIVGMMSENLSSSKFDQADEDYVQNLIKAQKIASEFIDKIGDPHFSPDSRILALNMSSKGYHHVLAEKLEKLESESKLNKMDGLKVEWRSDKTGSHTNVIDRDGMVVAVSSGLTSDFGSFRRSPLGFLWNNQMSSFSEENSEDQNVNSVEGSKRSRTDFSPLILMKNSKPVLALGVTGSMYSTFAAAQVILNWIEINNQSSIDSKLSIDYSDSISLPRFYATSYGALFESTAEMSLLSSLQSRGISLNPLLSTDTSVNILFLENNSSSITAICDHRAYSNYCASGF